VTSLLVLGHPIHSQGLLDDPDSWTVWLPRPAISGAPEQSVKTWQLIAPNPLGPLLPSGRPLGLVHRCQFTPGMSPTVYRQAWSRKSCFWPGQSVSIHIVVLRPTWARAHGPSESVAQEGVVLLAIDAARLPPWRCPTASPACLSAGGNAVAAVYDRRARSFNTLGAPFVPQGRLRAPLQREKASCHTDSTGEG
jgi:hypothetical protein